MSTKTRKYIKKRKYEPSQAIIDYIEAHKVCEACQMAPVHGIPHHIKTTGAHGRIDEDWNLLGLCWNCHYGKVHNMPGIRGLMEEYPRIQNKVQAALSKEKEYKE